MTPVNPWVVRWNVTARPRLRLICFPYAGGGAVTFHGWQDLLPRDIELCAVQLPGRESRLAEKPMDRMADLVPALADALGGLLDRPYATFGHSLGSVIGFETVHHLVASGAPAPRRMFVGGSRAPQVRINERSLHTLPDDEFLRSVMQLNGTDPTVALYPELLALALPFLRADFTLSEQYEYTPRPRLDCPITVFNGESDQGVPEPDARLWAEQTSAAFRLRVLPGDHFFLRESQRALLAEIVTDLS